MVRAVAARGAPSRRGETKVTRVSYERAVVSSFSTIVGSRPLGGINGEKFDKQSTASAVLAIEQS